MRREEKHINIYAYIYIYHLYTPAVPISLAIEWKGRIGKDVEWDGGMGRRDGEGEGGGMEGGGEEG